MRRAGSFAALLVVSSVVACSCRSHAINPAEHARTTAPGAPVPPAEHHSFTFAGDRIDIPGLDGTHVVSDPALPQGLALVAGRISGQPLAAIPGALYGLSNDEGQSTAIYLEVIARPTSEDLFVAPTGDDANAGTRDKPLRSIAHALASAKPGTTIFLHAGDYAEDVMLKDVHGAPNAPIVIRSYPGEHATLEGARLALDWKKATDPHAAPDEWVATTTFDEARDNPASFGAFMHRVPYTKLLTYSRLEDFRAANQQWIHDRSAPGPNIVGKGPPRPWTYFGPGLWQDEITGELHLRLSHTANHVEGLAEYDGATDPARVDLGVWRRNSVAVRVHGASFVELRDLAVIGGGTKAVDVDESTDIVFDHVDVSAAMLGVEVTNSTRVHFTHGRIDGGIPPWTFRTDYKDNYKFVAADGATADDDLIRKTSRGVLGVGPNNREITVSYSELVNGHDIYMAGINSELDHCLIRDIQDDALVISHTPQIDNLRVHDNVFERVLTAISGAGRTPTGPRYLYRNIFDLRERTAGTRPPGVPGSAEDDVWRFGHVFKDDFSAGPTYFYQNTILLGRPGAQIGLAFFKSLEDNGVAVNPRWFLNNVTAIDGSSIDRSLEFIPEASYREAKRADGLPVLYADGNSWVRTGAGKTPLFTCADATKHCKAHSWASIEDVRTVGFEVHSRFSATPAFKQLRSLSQRSRDDDTRPADSAPAAGIALPPELPDDGPRGNPHPYAGALGAGSRPMRIGVDGELVY